MDRQEPTPKRPPTDARDRAPGWARAAAREVAAEFGPDYYQRAATEGRQLNELWRALGRRGLLGAHLGDRGCERLSLLAEVVEETAAAGCPLLPALYSCGVVGAILARHGSAAQRRRWLGGVADGSVVASFAFTEAGAGSNPRNLATVARRRPGGYVIDGRKHQVSGLEAASLLLVVARVETPGGREPGGLSVFALDPGAAGLSRAPIATAMSTPERQWDLTLDAVPVDAGDLIGGEGEGLRVAFAGMNVERILVASLCAGLGDYALSRAAGYARERAVWGRPIGAHQAIAHPLAEARIELEAARLMAREACALHDRGVDPAEAANMAKLLGVDAGTKALEAAIQTHGGNGVALEYQLANYWFLLRAMRIGPVSRELVLNFVAERSLGLPRSY